MTTTTHAGRPLTGYRSGIASATGVTDADTITMIEELMRIDSGGSTMDHLTRDQFNRTARRAHAEITAQAQADVPRRVGDLVGCSRRPGVTYRIKRINGQSYGLENVATGRPLRASKSLVTDPPADNRSDAGKVLDAAIAAETTVHMVIGTVARWDGPKAAAGVEPGGLVVILRDNGETIRAARLGGCNDRYIDKARRDWFTPVDVATILTEGTDL